MKQEQNCYYINYISHYLRSYIGLYQDIKELMVQTLQINVAVELVELERERLPPSSDVNITVF